MVISAFVIMLGLTIGSFLNVLIYRLPRGKSIVFPASACTNCSQSLRFYHNIPLLSFLLLRGKCSFCKTKIAWHYPLIELVTALIFVSIYAKVGLNLQALALAIYFALLLSLSIIDLYFKAVPDSLNLLTATLALFTSFSVLESLESALIIAGALTMLRYYLSFFLKKEAMGEGDIITGFGLGALLGLQASFMAIFLAAVLAIPFSLYQRFYRQNLELPFIPFLALASFISFYFTNELQGLLFAR